jgi:hypothetical protein
MKGKIDTNGVLYLQRGHVVPSAAEMKKQYCPYSPDCSPCGDWCPLFDELETMTAPYGGLQWALRLCRIVRYFAEKDFTDERGKVGKNGK